MSYLAPHQSWDIVDFAAWQAGGYEGPIVGRCSCGHQIGPDWSPAVSVAMQQHRDTASREIKAQQKTERRLEQTVGREQVALW